MLKHVSGVFCDNGHGVQHDFSLSENAPFVSSDLERYLKVQKVNNAVREIFLNQFAHMFSVYEHFVIQPNQVYILSFHCYSVCKYFAHNKRLFCKKKK